MVGHAERRRLFHETDAEVAQKTAGVLRNSMIPLVCIGEKTQGSVREAVEECRVQVESVLEMVGVGQEVWFAYEPVWAIGASEAAGGEWVRGVVGGLKGVSEDFMEEKGMGSREIRWLYGGSAGPGTWGEIGGEDVEGGVDGLFLGRFAHDIQRLRMVVEEVGGGLLED